MPTYAKEYQDLDFDFTANPITGDVAKVKNTTSVKRGIHNILMTENSERLFQPEIGSGLKNLLFEPMTDLTTQLLEDEVRSAIDAWENRAQVISIEVFPEEEYNRYRVAVIFRIVNDPKEQQTEVLLSRER
jgi:phage baseplate assembly protein W